MQIVKSARDRHVLDNVTAGNPCVRGCQSLHGNCVIMPKMVVMMDRL